MEQTLTDKNVAVEIAREVCSAVGAQVEGKTLGAFSLTRSFVYKAFREALTRIVTPSRQVHLFRAISEAREESRPYTIVFVGVNGVGKSTSLSKVANYLKKRGLQISIAACDTFRSGAVEQLLTHARALKMRVFHEGYAKDAADVCYKAIRKAKELKDDVLLIDTAGRMQNNEPLMRSLKKLVEKNKPDLVLFVGEALVGNEALNQLAKFDENVSIDAIVLSKFDVVDDKVGAAISMTYKTNFPILFLGTGQRYEDLEKVKPSLLVDKLLR